MGHTTHPVELKVALYCPATHSAHRDAPGPLYVPESQGKHATIPTPLAYRPAVQSLHVTVPVEFENLPTLQGAHTALAPPALNCPAGQMVPVTAVEPAGQPNPGLVLHAAVQVGELTPVLPPYRPDGHDEHVKVPTVEANLPCVQGVHEEAPDPPSVIVPSGQL
jgi:hypothetical protein